MWVSTVGSNNSGSISPFSACQWIVAVASANLSSMRMSCVTDSASGASLEGNEDLELPEDAAANIVLHQPSHNRPPISNAVAAGAAPLGLAGGGAGSGRRGNCQSLRNAGITTCKSRNAPRTTRNTVAPFGYRRAAQMSSIQPKTQPAVLDPRRSITHPNTHTASASSAGQA